MQNCATSASPKRLPRPRGQFVLRSTSYRNGRPSTFGLTCLRTGPANSNESRFSDKNRVLLMGFEPRRQAYVASPQSSCAPDSLPEPRFDTIPSRALHVLLIGCGSVGSVV